MKEKDEDIEQMLLNNASLDDLIKVKIEKEFKEKVIDKFINDEKLKELKPNSVWVFTKQETDFDESYKSALLFSEVPDKENTNIKYCFYNLRIQNFWYIN